MIEREVNEAVWAVLRDRFPDAKVANVSVRPDVDRDGDDILRVVIVLDGTLSSLDKKELFGFVRHLRSRLETVNREEFPVLSFVSKKDAKQMNLEAA
jgi:hypothetical protein